MYKFKGTAEYERNVRMIDEMAELKGKIVLGSSWALAAMFGRGETKQQVLEKQESNSPVFFAQNYLSEWVGSVENALVNIGDVLDLRTIANPVNEVKSKEDREIYLSMDVARSSKDSASQSSIAVLEVKRNKKMKISRIRLINLINLEKGLSFERQTVDLKRLKHKYDAKMIIIDGNTLGAGIIDEALKEHADPITGESLGCWDTVNTDQKPHEEDAEKIIYDLKAQGVNNDIIINFIDMIEGKKLLLLEKKQDAGYDVKDQETYKKEILPHLQVDFLIEEIANLKLKQLSSGKLGIERVTRRLDKDRFSAVAYGCYYIMKFEDDYQEEAQDNIRDFIMFSDSKNKRRGRRFTVV